MLGLPDGWEADYDGRRWFYKYKPTGHVQYHFPKEGDEFPDFVDTLSPVPDLAPEERLESQQQVRRYASTTTPSRLSPKKDDGGYGMSATARPVSMTWDGGFEDDNAVFQPENFMYLGPGTYNDVSPLAEEEEEAARRVVAGGIEGRVDKSPTKGVSPMGSEKTTPAASTIHPGPVTGDPILVPPTVPEEIIHEMPVIEPPPAPDPVGLIPEMPTYDTAQADIELHPPPIEMADNMVLAPIETAVSMMAELPVQSSSVEKRKEEPQLAPGSLRDYSAQMQPLRPAKEPVEGKPPAVQAHTPRDQGLVVQIPPNPAPLRRATFQPGEQLVDASPIQPPHRGHAGTPNVLSPPQIPPKRPLDEPSQPQIPPKYLPGQSSAPPIGISSASSAQVQQNNLSSMPSVLKPARGKDPSRSDQQSQPRVPGSGVQMQGHGYVPPAQGQHPPSMTPAPPVKPQQLKEPRIGIQRINTMPDELPSQRPQSTIGYQGLPLGSTNQQHAPKRPASVMPNMMGVHAQEHIRGRHDSGPQQSVKLPYRSPIESIPSTGLPRSATAGPTAPFPPYPLDNLPYPDDRPPIRRENPPYPPDEPLVPNPMPPGPRHAPTADPSSPGPNGRRHSSFSSALVSPDSRHGSLSYPIQTPSPMENNRRASTSSSTNPNYTPSPVSQASSSIQGFSPTPPPAPTNQPQQGSYFTRQDVESQVNNTAARDVLRKKSLSRGAEARRSSASPDTVGAQRGPPHPPQSAKGPSPPPQGQQGLGRIEEHDEARSIAASQSSVASVSPETRRSSYASSVQPSPVASRRTSWQAESPKNASPGHFQEQQAQIPQGSVGQPLPHDQASRGAPLLGQNPKQLQRKPSQGNASPQPQGQANYVGQRPVQGQVPARDPRAPPGVSAQQGPGPRQPIEGQLPPTRVAQGQLPQPGQTHVQSQKAPQRPSPQGQALPPQSSQIQAPHPGQVPLQSQNPPHGPAPSGYAPKPGPTRLQKRSSYGPSSSTGQLPPQSQLPQGQLQPGQMPQSPMPQGPIPQQGPVPGQMPPLGQPHPLQMNHPGQFPNARIQPQVQIPQNQQPWPPGMQPATAHPSRPVPLQPQASQSAGAKEGKDGKKWLKWLKGGSKSVSHSPTTPLISSPMSPVGPAPRWGGGEYSQHAVWQPGQPISAASQPGVQGSAVYSQTNHSPPQPGQMAAQSSQALLPTGQLPPGVSQARPQPGQMHPQPGQTPSQAGRLPSQPSPTQTGPVQPPLGPTHPQSMDVISQARQPPPQPSQSQPQPMQKPPKGVQAPPPNQPMVMNLKHESHNHSTAAAPLTGSSTMGHATTSSVPAGSAMMAPPRVAPSNTSHQQPPPKQPSSVEPTYAPKPSSEQIQISRSKAPQSPQVETERASRFSAQIPVPQSEARQPHQHTQTPAPQHLQLQPDTRTDASPQPLAVSPSFSDVALSSVSRMSSQRRDSLSDSGSITTIEVSEAKPQPVLKPSIIQVHRRSTDMFRKSQEIKLNDSQSNSDITPRISAETAHTMRDTAESVSKFQQQQQQQQQPIVQPEPRTQANVPDHSIPAMPAFQDHKSLGFVHPSVQHENKEQPAHTLPEHSSLVYTRTSVPSQQRNYPTETISHASQPQIAKPTAPPVEDKWAKKPVVDYSGGDWGDDDEWDY
ncbi:hypothetical protein F66182_10366 [Fusarium sp. NRRL 66182]|nr:hypothetical protein F66182_10366 [Fusarium sp. NRRL 66182]